MQSLNDNIYPIFNQIISKREKENRLKQNAKCIWLTGLSGSGKTTLALKLEKTLFEQGFLVQILDGDNIRTGISNNLDFSENDRLENIRRIAEVSKLFVNCGIITINCFVSPSNKIRLQAKKIIGEVAGFNRVLNSEACEFVSSLTGDNSREVVSFGTEAGLFQEIGISTVVCGPGSIEQAHKVDEFIELSELKKCIKFLDGIREKSSIN